MKNTRYAELKQELCRDVSPEEAGELVRLMDEEYDRLCRDYAHRPRALESHTHNNIFPVVAAFRALMARGVDRQQASATAQAAFLRLMDAPAKAIRKLLKLPGLHRMVPWLFRTLMPKLFGEDAGFRFAFHPAGRGRARFDMLQCPYLQICRELDCPELAPVFCATDDVCYGHMHPNLIWNRTKTLARGGDCCDFDLYLKK